MLSPCSVTARSVTQVPRINELVKIVTDEEEFLERIHKSEAPAVVQRARDLIM
jgi:hypothetical protein